MLLECVSHRFGAVFSLEREQYSFTLSMSNAMSHGPCDYIKIYTNFDNDMPYNSQLHNGLRVCNLEMFYYDLRIYEIALKLSHQINRQYFINLS